mgnify:CR=1 FL=1
MEDQVDDDVARRRVELVVDLQSRVMDEWNESRLGETVETFENLSLKPDALNNVCVKTAKSDLICVEVTAAKAPPPPPQGEGQGRQGDPAAAPRPAYHRAL